LKEVAFAYAFPCFSRAPKAGGSIACAREIIRGSRGLLIYFGA